MMRHSKTYLKYYKEHIALTKTAENMLYLTVSSEQPADQSGKGIERETY